MAARSSPTLALLRGINVSGRHRVPMADLRQLLTDAGCGDVRTVLQSGNAAFLPPSGVSQDQLAVSLTAGLSAHFGFSLPVVLRSLEQLRDAVAQCPLPVQGVDPRHLHLGFLADLPDLAAVAAMDPDRSPPDRFAVVGQHIYLHTPKGVGRSRLTSAWLDRQLGTVCTARNWRTVGRLFELAAGLATADPAS